MANPHRGSVALQAGDRAYTLSFSINALCELEDVLDKPVAQIANELNSPESARISTVRALVWAGLRDHHEEIEIKDAGSIIKDAGLPACMEAVGKAFKLAFPEQEAQDSGRPQRAKA